MRRFGPHEAPFGALFGLRREGRRTAAGIRRHGLLRFGSGSPGMCSGVVLRQGLSGCLRIPFALLGIVCSSLRGRRSYNDSGPVGAGDPDRGQGRSYRWFASQPRPLLQEQGTAGPFM